MKPPRRRAIQRTLEMFSLVLAGEAVFGLPFHVSRYFRPTFVDVFDISQTQLGVLGSVYGVVAMFAYLAGGGLADRISARALLVFSLSVTGLSGLYLASIPSYTGMCLLYAFWGLSTILPFWSALIKATRQWGGRDEQGEAFGLLDGGRGLLAAVLATVALFLFSQSLVNGGDSSTPEEKHAALIQVIYVYTFACCLAAACVWLFLPAPTDADVSTSTTPSLRHLDELVRMPVIWLQAAIIIAAYCAFKSTDYFSQFASDVWGWSDVRSAGLSAYSSWMRVFAAIAAGLLADRLSPSGVVIGSFTLTAVAFVAFIATPPSAATIWVLWVSALTGCLGTFALRGIYFALLEESEIPHELTGTAVGVVSFIGFTPEIFMPLIAGWLIDRWSGAATGYQVLFSLLCAISAMGIAAALLLRRQLR